MCSSGKRTAPQPAVGGGVEMLKIEFKTYSSKNFRATMKKKSFPFRFVPGFISDYIPVRNRVYIENSTDYYKGLIASKIYNLCHRLTDDRETAAENSFWLAKFSRICPPAAYVDDVNTQVSSSCSGPRYGVQSEIKMDYVCLVDEGL